MTIKCLVLVAGGIPAIQAHLSTISELEQKKMIKLDEIERVVGVSAGALIGTFVAIGLSWTETEDMFRMDMKDGLSLSGSSSTAFFSTLGICDIRTRLSLKLGMVVAKRFQISTALAEKLTLKQRHEYTNVHLQILTTDLTHLRCLLLDHINTPDTTIVAAVTASMAVPILIPPEIMHYDGVACTCVDGAMLDHCPTGTIPRGIRFTDALDITETLVLHLEKTVVRTPDVANNIGTFLRAVIACISYKLSGMGDLSDGFNVICLKVPRNFLPFLPTAPLNSHTVPRINRVAVGSVAAYLTNVTA